MTYAPERPPLRFVSPAGWPTPSPAWVARNQAWQPPAGWIPPAEGVSVLQPAPAGWRFWVEDPQSWPVYRAPFAKSVHRTLAIGGLMFGVGAIVTLAGYLGELGGTFLILWGAIVFGAVRIVVGLRNLRRVDGIARAALVGHARQVRRELDESAYPYYLDQTARVRAETGAPAMSLDEFAVSRDAEPWQYLSAPGSWSSVAGAPGPGAAWTTEPAPVAARSRRGVWIAAGAVVALAIGLAIPIALAPSHSSASAAGPTGNYDLPDSAWTIEKSTSCASGNDCWNMAVTPPKDCATATITWGFAASDSGDEKATRTTTQPLVAGRRTTVSIPVDSEIQDYQYIGLDGVRCAA